MLLVLLSLLLDTASRIRIIHQDTGFLLPIIVRGKRPGAVVYTSTVKSFVWWLIAEKRVHAFPKCIHRTHLVNPDG